MENNESSSKIIELREYLMMCIQIYKSLFIADTNLSFVLFTGIFLVNYMSRSGAMTNVQL